MVLGGGGGLSEPLFWGMLATGGMFWGSGSDCAGRELSNSATCVANPVLAGFLHSDWEESSPFLRCQVLLFWGAVQN